jgi:hypothetical protein
MRTKFSIIGGETEKLINLTPDVKVTNIGVTRRLDVNMIKDISKLFESPELAADNFIYTIMREFAHCVVEDLVEATQYIDNVETVYHVTMYCKKIDREEVEILTEEQYKEFKAELVEFLKKHWEWKGFQFNDKEFMKEQNSK